MIIELDDQKKKKSFDVIWHPFMGGAVDKQTKNRRKLP